jgi:hypothetical protein
MNITQIELNFTPVLVVKNNWTDIWHVKSGHYAWPEDTEQISFSSIAEACAFAKSHGANPHVVPATN